MAVRYLRKAKRSAITGTALLRVDFNTKDDWRMQAIVPTVKLLINASGRIVVASHRGRPTKSTRKDLSLRSDAAKLSRLIGRPVVFVDHFRFAAIRREVAASPEGSIFLLENLRFEPGEERNDPGFARSLASLADFYVNDAFAVSHRANASVAAVTKFLPSYAGLEMEREIESLSRVMKKPRRPLVVVLGGAKAADKLGVIRYFLGRTDWFLLGGGPANTALSLEGMDIKKSVADRDPDELKALRPIARSKKVMIPADFVWSGGKILDVGPRTARIFAAKLASARTILWSGPLGLIEERRFAKGSLAVARAITRNRKAFSVTGGGETVMFLKEYGLDSKFSFISTGGGAMVDFLAGKKLPGIAALG